MPIVTSVITKEDASFYLYASLCGGGCMKWHSRTCYELEVAGDGEPRTLLQWISSAISTAASHARLFSVQSGSTLGSLSMFATSRTYWRNSEPKKF